MTAAPRHHMYNSPPPHHEGNAPLAALARIPAGRFILTASHEGVVAGRRITWVQQCGSAPPSVSIALAKGEPISPLIRDSHCFGLCQVPPNDDFLWRAFHEPVDADHGVAVFPSLETFHLDSTTPLLARSLAVLDCRVTMHLDFESDHELFIGEVVAARLTAEER
ncbi:MAG: flavin reductase [Planctomycetota bacterium]